MKPCSGPVLYPPGPRPAGAGLATVLIILSPFIVVLGLFLVYAALFATWLGQVEGDW